MQKESNEEQYVDAQETLELLFEMSKILNCQIDKQSLSILVTLIENGVDPIAVANIFKEIKNEHLSNS